MKKKSNGEVCKYESCEDCPERFDCKDYDDSDYDYDDDYTHDDDDDDDVSNDLDEVNILNDADYNDYENKIDLLEKLSDAQEKLNEVIDILDECCGLDEHNGSFYREYLVNKLKIYASENHGFLTNDPNIDKWKEKIEGD